jgi:DNA-binding CsgD family transcriptional regulator
MELLERDKYFDDLADYYQLVSDGIGHTVFLTGEAGIGKTSLVNQFAKKIGHEAIILSGACDSLFTPRPLGPLFDIARQIGQNFNNLLKIEKDRSVIFAALVEYLSSAQNPVVLLFEDIHWADEATLDLIKFLARRIHRYKCLFLLTYRDNELGAGHPLCKIFGELPPPHFSKISIAQFSKETVARLALQRGYGSGDQLYNLTGGNPFYVMEVLGSKTSTIPERVKDSILNVFHSKDDTTRALWELLSILPSSIEVGIAKRVQQDLSGDMDGCLASGVVVLHGGYLSFKHELFRMAIEESLSPLKRQSLHKMMLKILQQDADTPVNLSQLLHHARYADEKKLVGILAPKAAREAAAVDSHREAAKLYGVALEYTEMNGAALAELYEGHAYECYLTYDITQAIESQQRALEIWRSLGLWLKEGNALRFLSRLWWSAAADYEKAMSCAKQSIEVLEKGLPTRELALAYSNFSQLFMLSEDRPNALLWGNKAIDLATTIDDAEILSHALNNVGTTLLQVPASESEGELLLNRSLSIAMEHNFQEHVARAYVNLTSSSILVKRYDRAASAFEAGLKYCETHDLDFLSYYLLSCNAQLLLETGKWADAETIATTLLSKNHLLIRMGSLATMARLCMRSGRFKMAEEFIREGKSIAMRTREPQRIIPVVTAALELYWLTGTTIIFSLDEVREAEKDDVLFPDRDYSWQYASLSYWMRKVGEVTTSSCTAFPGPHNFEHRFEWKAAADAWKEIGCPYEQALALFLGDEIHQRESLTILNDLGAAATRDKLKSDLKLKGVKNIPRGLRESTRKNPAQLTDRQIEILVRLKEGSTYKEIADKLFISPKTVEHHISAILEKLDVNSRSKAVLKAESLGVIK